MFTIIADTYTFFFFCYINLPFLSFSHVFPLLNISFFFFFNDTAPTEFYPLSLHDALPISVPSFSLLGTSSFLLRRLTRLPIAPDSRRGRRSRLMQRGLHREGRLGQADL